MIMRGNDRPVRRERVERGIYRQPNGRYAVCFMLDGKPRFRTVGYDLDLARAERQAFVDAARWGVIAAAPRLRFDTVAAWWLERFARKVAAGERRERTLEIHRYHLDRHLQPLLGQCLIRQISAVDVADLLERAREKGCSEKTVAGTLATLQSVMRFAVRNGWIAESPVGKLDPDERPRPVRREQRVLGREEIARLMEACMQAYRALIATALYTGMRLSELLCLIWDDVNLEVGSVECARSCPAPIAMRRRVASRRRHARRFARSRSRRSLRRCCVITAPPRATTRARTGSSVPATAHRSASETCSEARSPTPPAAPGSTATPVACASTTCGTPSPAI